MNSKLIDLILEWSELAASGGFVPYQFSTNADTLNAFIAGFHSGETSRRTTDEEWSRFSAWLRSQGHANESEGPGFAARRRAGERSLFLLAAWAAEFRAAPSQSGGS